MMTADQIRENKKTPAAKNQSEMDFKSQASWLTDFNCEHRPDISLII